jgi:fatty acid desaturase
MKLDQEEEGAQAQPVHLTTLRPRGNPLLLYLCGAAFSGLGLFLLTLFSGSVWLFLLYPLLIATLVLSIGLIALHLLRLF